MQKIVFEPWVGRNYKNSRFGVPVLVLGESHYGDESETRPTVTIDVVHRLAQTKRHPFFTKVSKILLGIDQNGWIDDRTRGEIW